MSFTSPEASRVLVDTSGTEATRTAALEAVAEHSFSHRHYFTLLGDTKEIAQSLGQFPYEAEYVETLHCSTPAEALVRAGHELHSHPTSLFVSAQESRRVSQALRDARALLPDIDHPVLTAVIPAVKSLQIGERDRYVVMLDIEGHRWDESSPATQLIALARPLVAWFHHGSRIRVGVLCHGGGVAFDEEQRTWLETLDTLALPFVNAGALNPTQVMLGEADLVLCSGERGAMFVRTLEATFVAAEALVDRESQGVRGRLGVRIFRDRLDKLRDYGNVESYGGHPLLGVQSPTIVLRPDASPRAWINALRIANKMRKEQLIEQQRMLLAHRPPSA